MKLSRAVSFSLSLRPVAGAPVKRLLGTSRGQRWHRRVKDVLVLAQPGRALLTSGPGTARMAVFLSQRPVVLCYFDFPFMQMYVFTIVKGGGMSDLSVPNRTVFLPLKSSDITGR